MKLSTKIGATVVAALALSLGGKLGYEGRRNTVYRDLVGIPTVCDGITGPGLVVGKVYTDAECDQLLMSAIYKHQADVSRCIDLNSLPPNISFAIQHFAYNVGASRFCRSTMRKLMARGDFTAGCAEFRKWTYVGGKDCRRIENRCGGIVRRRDYEQAVCEGRVDWRTQRWFIEPEPKILIEAKTPDKPVVPNTGMGVSDGKP